MIASPLTRRSVVAGLLGTATLSGCSVADLTTRKIEDPQAADRMRLAQARALSAQLHAEIEAMITRDPALLSDFTSILDLHTAQIAQFTRSAGLATPTDRAAVGTSTPVPTPVPLTPRALPDRERELARDLRNLALGAQAGDVAALLASAAAGIDQAVTR